MKKVLFIGATHGDEPIGVEVLQKIKKCRDKFDFIIGNKPAFNMNQREFEGDLNRSGPGDINSKRFSQKRAAEIIKKSNDYEYTIDIHGSDNKVGLFIIITNPKPINLKLAAMLGIKNIVYWPAFTPELRGPLSEFFSCGLEIECGPKNNTETQKLLQKTLIKFLKNFEKLEKVQFEKLLKKKKIYKVYGELKTPTKKKLKEFKKVNIENEIFYPLLIGSYSDNGVNCYKTKKVRLTDIC